MTANALDDLDAIDRRNAWLGYRRRGNESRFISP
jgi:hypothetical protein